MDKDIRRRLFTDSAVLFLSAALLAGCAGISPTVTSSSQTTLDDPTADTRIVVNAPEETPTPTPDEDPEGPPVIPVITNLYDDVQVTADWHTYLMSLPVFSDSVPGSDRGDSYSRLSTEYIGQFSPSDEYGCIFPFLAISDSDDNSIPASYDVSVARYGLLDSKGRIVCDGIFDYVYDLPGKAFYITRTIEDGNSKFGVLLCDGTYYTGQIYDMMDSGYDIMSGREYVYMRRLTEDGLTVTVYSEDGEIYIDETTVYFDLDGFVGEDTYAHDDLMSSVNVVNMTRDGLLFVYDQYTENYYMVDISTGEITSVSGYNDLTGWTFTGGGYIVREPDIQSDLGTCGFMTLNGDLTMSGFKNFDICEGSYILFYDIDHERSVLVDIYGNIIHEFDGTARYVGGDYYLYNGDEAVILDRNFEQTGTTDVDIRVFSHIHNNINTRPQYESVIFEGITSNSVLTATAVNALTGDSVSLRAENPGVYLLDDGSFCLRASGVTRVYDYDMEETIPQCSESIALYDESTGRGYVYVYGDKIFDSQYGEEFLDFVIPVYGTLKRIDIYEGYVLIMSNNVTILFDSEGHRIFTYNSIHVMDD